MTRSIGYTQETVTRIELQYGVSSGVSMRALGDGMVPLYEEHAARLEAHIGLEEWGAKSLVEKAFLIAHRRLSISMKNLQTEAEIKDSERKAKRVRKK